MEWRIAKGIITETKKKVGIGAENFSTIFKKLLNKFKVPYIDMECEPDMPFSPVHFNNETGNIERLSDPFEHIFVPIVFQKEYEVRYNPFQSQQEYYNPTTQSWVIFQSGGGSGGISQVNSDWNAVAGVSLILNKPILGTAAAKDISFFATASQGSKADTALQAETQTELMQPTLAGTTLSISYKGENGNIQIKSLNLAPIITNDTKVTSLSFDDDTNIVTLINSDSTQFTINLSEYSIVPQPQPDGSINLTQESSVKVNISKVGLTGKYEDLLDRPILGSAASQNITSFATASQGVKADNALQSITSGSPNVSIDTTDATNPIISVTQSLTNVAWGDITGNLTNQTDLNTLLNSKVNKVTGKQLSTEDYTTIEKNKLAAITGTNTGDQDLTPLATKVTTITAGTGLTGGGDLSQNRTIELSTATQTAIASANTALQPGDVSAVAISGLYSDLSAKPSIPSKTSELLNDSNFITSSEVDLSNYYTETEVNNLLTNKANVTHTHNIADVNNLQTTLNTKINTSAIGANSGVAPLNSSGKVPASYLELSGSEYLGVWNASTNTPTIIDGTGNSGDYYRVTVGGTQDLGAGSQIFTIGDDVRYNGTIWERVPSGQSVASVNGQTGVIVLDKDDIGLGNVNNTSDLSKPISTATQTALNLKANTADLHAVATSGNYTQLINRPDLKPVATSGSYLDLTNKPVNLSDFVNDLTLLALGETSTAAYRGDRGKSAYDHISLTNNPHGVTKAQVGLSNVENIQLSTWVGSSNITTLGTITIGTIPWARLSNVPTTFIPAAHTLDSHSNVTITANTNGEILKWDGSSWVNNTLAEAGIQPAGSYLTANQTITLTGNVTGSGSTSITTTIANDAVTNSRLANMSANTIKGNNTGASADPIDLTISQVKTMLLLNNVDNTSDANKPVSTATQTALNGKSDTGHTHSNATTSVAGFLSTADKIKLDGIAAGATVGATWGTNLSSIPTIISSLAGLSNGSGTLTNNGSGGLSWVPAGSSITIAADQIAYATAANTVGGNNNFKWLNSIAELNINGTIRLPATGNIKHGTTWASGKLGISNGETEYFLFDPQNNKTQSNLQKFLFAASGTAQIGTSDNQDLLLITNNTEKVRVTKDGKVGIATAPDATLHVNGNLYAVNNYSVYTSDGLFSANALPSRFLNVGASEIIMGYKDLGGGQYHPRIGFKPNTGGNGNNWSIGRDNNDTFTIKQNTTDLGVTIVGATNNIGVGTDSPSEKLHIEGNSILVQRNVGQKTSLKLNQAGVRDWEIANEATTGNLLFSSPGLGVPVTIFNSGLLQATKGIYDGVLATTHIKSAQLGAFNNILFKANINSACTFNVKIYVYPDNYYEFQLNLFKYDNTHYFPTVTWVAGDSNNIQFIDFYKDASNTLWFNVGVPSNQQSKVFITNFLGGTIDAQPENFQITANGSTASLTLVESHSQSKFKRDWLRAGQKVGVENLLSGSGEEKTVTSTESAKELYNIVLDANTDYVISFMTKGSPNRSSVNMRALTDSGKDRRPFGDYFSVTEDYAFYSGTFKTGAESELWRIYGFNNGTQDANPSTFYIKELKLSKGTVGTGYSKSNAEIVAGLAPIDTPITTGSIEFTQDKVYNSFGTPRTGNITHTLTGAQDGVTIVIYHSGGSEPTYPSEWKKLATSGTYSTTKPNMIYAQHIAGRVTFLITQEA